MLKEVAEDELCWISEVLAEDCNEVAVERAAVD